MAHYLVSMVGRDPPMDRSYQFANEWRSEKVHFFAFALERWLADHGPEIPVDTFLFLGTKGSSFAHFVADLLELQWGRLDHNELNDLNDIEERLASAADVNGVKQPDLDCFATLLGKALGKPVRMLLIDPGFEREGQLGALGVLRDAVAPGDSVTLDVTHAYRHLAMLGLAAAFILRGTRRVEVLGLWYGLEGVGEGGRAAAVQLDGLVDLLDWLGAFSVLEQTGDFWPFAKLLEKDDRQGSELLAKAAHFERMAMFGDQKNAIKRFFQHRAVACEGPAGLFADELRARLQPMRQGNSFERLTHMARHHVAKQDFWRASILIQEAFISRIVKLRNEQGIPTNHVNRGILYEAIKTAILNLHRNFVHDATLSQFKQDFFILQNLRNNAAHATLLDYAGNPARVEEHKEYRIAIELSHDFNRLTDFLDKAIKLFLEGKLPDEFVPADFPVMSPET